MDNSLATAIVSEGATALVAIVALIQNSKRFDEIGKRIERVEKQLDVIQSDLGEFFRTLAELGNAHPAA